MDNNEPVKPNRTWEHDGDLDYVVQYVSDCAKLWEPNARLVGEARACDIAKGIDTLLTRVSQYEKKLTALAQAQRDMRDPERKMVCDILANGRLAPWGYRIDNTSNS